MQYWRCAVAWTVGPSIQKAHLRHSLRRLDSIHDCHVAGHMNCSVRLTNRPSRGAPLHRSTVLTLSASHHMKSKSSAAHNTPTDTAEAVDALMKSLRHPAEKRPRRRRFRPYCGNGLPMFRACTREHSWG